MLTVRPHEGQTVVVQFGPDDISFTRCEATSVDDPRIELRPFDPLSGSGSRGEVARLIFTGAGRPTYVDAVCAEDASSSRLVVVADRREQVRSAAEFTIDLTLDEVTKIPAELVDLSMTGLRVTTTADLPPGCMASVRVWDTRGVSTRFDAEIVDADDGQVGMRFLEVSEHAQKRLELLVAGGGDDEVDSEA